METVVRDRQDAYHQALGAADQAGEAGPFVAFMLGALLTAMQEVGAG